MKIEKIKNFNQIILAIAGILGLVLLLVFIVMLVSELFYNWNIGSGRDTTITNSLISEEKADALSQEKLRLQIVSYESPKLVDTLNAVYIIPVSVSTLNKPEAFVEAAYSEGISALLSYSSPRKEGYYKENYFEGLFANIAVYRPITNETTLLFHERIMLSGLRTYEFSDEILLVFYTAEKDSNKDGLVNFNDDTNLCIYSLKNEKMHRISENTNSITSYQFIENSKDLLLELSISQYNDVKFKSYKPQKIMRYDFEAETLSEVIPAEIQQQVQNILDGQKSQQK